MQQPILVPLDGSAFAEAALSHAVAMARATSSSLLLFRAVEPVLSLQSSVWQPAITPLHSNPASESERAQRYLEGVARSVEAQGIEVRTQVHFGEPAGAILLRAETYPPPQAIVMATHGRSGLLRLVFGSVAEKVLHSAPVPLLLVRARDDQPAPVAPRSYRSILVPLDGSPFGERALGEAARLAALTGARLDLLSVVPAFDDFKLAEAGLVPMWQLASQHSETAQITTYLEQRAEALNARGLQVCSRLASGDAAQEILASAYQQESDLIVMATHGRSGLRRLWLGSVALHVLRDASAPVLLVRAYSQAGGVLTSDVLDLASPRTQVPME